ncbi:MAG TPA: secondary thiamine-phosphate synthase enzyme YjbQ [Elusimicrobiales bacterium]|nr:secondary thiamine-phosphate synthase enzyme YjbQ [Elusimicrobiales bacterium]
MVHKFKVKTSAKSEMADITREVHGIIREYPMESGVCHIFVPHTTCGLAINENADPDVKSDVIAKLNESVSEDFPYRHGEGNSPAHIKSVLVGSSLTVFVEETALLLGTWQGIYLCEYDGPRTREVWVKLIKG